MSIDLADLKRRPSQEVAFTLECSGNHGLPFFHGGIGNARWAGTPLVKVLEEAGVKNAGIEVVFWGSDAGDVEIKDQAHDVKMHQNFARSMSLADAMNPNNLLCYEMNGSALPPDNGAPVRLIVPGWYGVASVKWLKRIEIRDTRFMNLFMGRNYVTIREEVHNGETVWTESSVGRALLKSAPAKVTASDAGYRVIGAAWGAPIAKVEVKIDDGPWLEAVIDKSEEAEFAWKIWAFDWKNPSAGEHFITSRATDTSGRVQPAMEDPWIAKKHTYWESNGQITRQVRIG
jgi:DMSO/TMAO reductase YedYZ molybdopterin-dependent catalytic subunit